MASTMYINDTEQKLEENNGPEASSSPLGRGKHQQFHQTQYQPQMIEYTGKIFQLGEKSRLEVLNLTYRDQQYHLMDGRVIAHASQNQGLDTSKYSMPPIQFANGVINLNFDQKWDTVMLQ